MSSFHFRPDATSFNAAKLYNSFTPSRYTQPQLVYASSPTPPATPSSLEQSQSTHLQSTYHQSGYPQPPYPQPTHATPPWRFYFESDKEQERLRGDLTYLQSIDTGMVQYQEPPARLYHEPSVRFVPPIDEIRIDESGHEKVIHLDGAYLGAMELNFHWDPPISEGNESPSKKAKAAAEVPFPNGPFGMVRWKTSKAYSDPHAAFDNWWRAITREEEPMEDEDILDRRQELQRLQPYKPNEPKATTKRRHHLEGDLARTKREAVDEAFFATLYYAPGEREDAFHDQTSYVDLLKDLDSKARPGPPVDIKPVPSYYFMDVHHKRDAWNGMNEMDRDLEGLCDFHKRKTYDGMYIDLFLIERMRKVNASSGTRSEWDPNIYKDFFKMKADILAGRREEIGGMYAVLCDDLLLMKGLMAQWSRGQPSVEATQKALDVPYDEIHEDIDLLRYWMAQRKPMGLYPEIFSDLPVLKHLMGANTKEKSSEDRHFRYLYPSIQEDLMLFNKVMKIKEVQPEDLSAKTMVAGSDGVHTRQTFFTKEIARFRELHEDYRRRKRAVEESRIKNTAMDSQQDFPTKVSPRPILWTPAVQASTSPDLRRKTLNKNMEFCRPFELPQVKAVWDQA